VGEIYVKEGCAVEQKWWYSARKAIILEIHPPKIFATPKKFRDVTCELIAREQ